MEKNTQTMAKILTVANPQSFPSVLPMCQQTLQTIHSLLSHPSLALLRRPRFSKRITLYNENQNNSTPFKDRPFGIPSRL